MKVVPYDVALTPAQQSEVLETFRFLCALADKLDGWAALPPVQRPGGWLTETANDCRRQANGLNRAMVR